jgi:hypothetical protein
MTKVPTLPPPPGGDTHPAGGGRSVDEAIRGGVVRALGSPPGLFRVAVLQLWKGHYRVNLLAGPDAASVRIPHSYFVVAADDGEIISVTPPIVRTYP